MFDIYFKETIKNISNYNFLNKTISKFNLKIKRTFLEARLLKNIKRFYIVSEAQS